MSDLSLALESYVYYVNATHITLARKSVFITLARNGVHTALQETLRQVDKLENKETRALFRSMFIRRTFYTMRLASYDPLTTRLSHMVI